MSGVSYKQVRRVGALARFPKTHHSRKGKRTEEQHAAEHKRLQALVANKGQRPPRPVVVS